MLLIMFADIVCSEIGKVQNGAVFDFFADGPVLFFSTSVINFSKYILLVTLIMVRGFENAALSNFVSFQRNYRLETL